MSNRGCADLQGDQEGVQERVCAGAAVPAGPGPGAAAPARNSKDKYRVQRPNLVLFRVRGVCVVQLCLTRC